MDIERVNAEHFNEVANEWEENPRHVQLGQTVGRAIVDALAPRGTERALEFGAGTGLLSVIVAPRVASLTALDLSSGMLSVLRRKCERDRLGNVEIIEGTVPKNLPAGSFDIVYSSMTLHHVGDVPALFRTLAAQMRCGGRVAFADLDREDGSFHNRTAGVVHHGFDRAEFGRWLEEAGFTDVRFSTISSVQHENDDGTTRDYPVFLAVATRT